MADTAAKTNVFQFMVVRAPNSVPSPPGDRHYIKDDTPKTAGRVERDLFSADSRSKIGPLVYKKVFCEDVVVAPTIVRRPLGAPLPSVSDIVSVMLETLPVFEPACPNPTKAGVLETLADRTFLAAPGRFYLLPDRLDSLEVPLIRKLIRILEVLRAQRGEPDGTLDVTDLTKQLETVFDGKTLREVVFSRLDTYAEDFATAKAELFDTLYLLYILRRRVTVNLEHIIDGLRALHVLEALAAKPPNVATFDDLAACLAATPVIHPLFARLHRFKEPFNNIKPLGIGDLKVVKQWLCGYKAGDFAHVENVLDGETKVRLHRRLEKTEELFASSSEKQEESQRDTQSTDRFELKREAESVIKQDLAVNANAGVTYTYGMIVANVTAGMAYTRSQTDQNKAADSFSREVVDKAVKRIQSKVTEQRSTTMLFETEETNTHTLTAAAGKGHISGIYRWLDKEYRAQLFNYGKRLMYEFVLPEPAAFFVEARLRAYESQIDVPKPPSPADRKIPHLAFQASAIDRAKFNDLRLSHDLSDISYPVTTKTVTFKNPATGQAFLEGGSGIAKIWQPMSFTCDLGCSGYDVTSLIVEGTIQFSGPGSDGTPANDALRNLLAIKLDGTQLFFGRFDPDKFHSFHTPNTGTPDQALHNFPAYSLTADKVDLVVSSQNAQHWELEISARLQLSAAAFAEWQQNVYQRVYKAEQERLDVGNAEALQGHQAQMATYHNRLGELRTLAINDLLQGQSDAFNRALIAKEIKRLCLATLTKDFDSDLADDVTTKIDAIGGREVAYTYRQLTVKEDDPAAPTRVDVHFETLNSKIDYPVPNLATSAIKARYIQFLEQAFDWQQMASIFYPYFWAAPPRWIDLMSRSDAGDANMSAFLQAGSCKVLLAVSPAYDDAVMHYLATGESWEGGPAPVIGDPLYVPLYEELRKQQDDLDGATPEGQPWRFTVPTSLVYLENSSTPLPKSVCEDL